MPADAAVDGGSPSWPRAGAAARSRSSGVGAAGLPAPGGAAGGAGARCGPLRPRSRPRWRRTSYTDITAARHEARVGSEPEEPLIDDEPGGRASRRTGAAATVAGARCRRPSLLPGWARRRRRHVRAPGAGGDRLRRRRPRRRAARRGSARCRPARGRDRRPARVVAGLAAALETPLGPVLGGAALSRHRPRRPARRARLRAAAGRRRPPDRELTLDRIAAVLRDWLRAGRSAGRLRRPARRPRPARSVRGYLTGSLDLVVRIPGAATAACASVCRARLQDQLAGRARRAADRWHYRPEALRGRDAPPPLRAAGAAVLGRAAPLPALAAAGYDPDATSPASCTCSCAG